MQHQCVGVRGGGDSGYECQEDRTKDWLLEQTVCRSCTQSDTSDTPANNLNKQTYCVDKMGNLQSKPSNYRFKDSSDAQETNKKTDCSALEKSRCSNLSLSPATSNKQIVCKTCSEASEYGDSSATNSNNPKDIGNKREPDIQFKKTSDCRSAVEQTGCNDLIHSHARLSCGENSEYIDTPANNSKKQIVCRSFGNRCSFNNVSDTPTHISNKQAICRSYGDISKYSKTNDIQATNLNKETIHQYYGDNSKYSDSSETDCAIAYEKCDGRGVCSSDCKTDQFISNRCKHCIFTV